MRTRNKRRMTNAEFAAVRILLKNVSSERMDAAYSALVLGEVLQVIANKYGCSRQAVNDTVNVVWASLQTYEAAREAEDKALNNDLPKGWKMVSIAAPVSLINQFKKDVSQYRQLSEQKSRQAGNLSACHLSPIEGTGSDD